MRTTSDRQILLLDTHIWLWLVAGNELARGARDRIGGALGAGLLRIAAISLWEIALLASRRRIVLGQPIDLWFAQALADPAPVIEALSPSIAAECYQLPGRLHGDPADRMIVATARIIDAVLMTRDRQILAYAEGGHLAAVPA